MTEKASKYDQIRVNYYYRNNFFTCYTTYIQKNAYLCSVIKKNKINPFSKRWKTTKDVIMKKNENEILMLQYRIKRYQAMGNGIMTQKLNNQLQKLLAKQGAF